MSLIKWKPNLSMTSHINEWDNFLDDFFGKSTETKSEHWLPSVDIHENKIEFNLTADLPGLSKKDVKINIDDSVLTVSGERLYPEKRTDVYIIERGYGKFNRSFTLPENVNIDKISASFKNGELKIILPKTEQTISKSKEIKIS
ncbi:MAG: heat-shock protein [Candidatus Marinimicrobia bacterium]|nr:heat-shock protein [Candidatus Neomarinimicrobiota bacterium]